MVFAYHEIVENAGGKPNRCEIYYRGALSPDFYAWGFPHGDTMSIGVGSAQKGFSLRGAVAALRGETDLGPLKTLRGEGAPIPLEPLKRWDNGRDVLLAGDAAGRSPRPRARASITRCSAEGWRRKLSTNA